MKLLITGTSHLMPQNRAWAKLAARHEVVFAAQNEWSDAFLAADSRLHDAEVVLWIVALEDTLDPHGAATQTAGADIQHTLDVLLVPLRAALSRASNVRFIVAWSVPFVSSPILTARHPALPWDDAAHAFLERLRELQARHDQLYLLPLNCAFGEAGMSQCFDARNFYACNCRYSFRGIQVIAGGVSTILERFQKAAAKVLVLDCDNTLWGGVVAEEGLEGILLGQDGTGRAFQDFQRAAKRLTSEGVLLALASKNTEADVWQVFDKHPGMILRRDDIVSTYINWNDKSANLVAMAEELGLALDSFVLWDDSSLERGLVRSTLPEVLVPEVPRDVCEWGSYLTSLSAFHRFVSTAEDRNRLAQYQAREKFRAGLRAAGDELPFLRSMNLRAEATPVGGALLGRAEQLCAKTNQFNLRTQRHSAAELKRQSESMRAELFLTHLEDRFADHGHAGLVLARVADESSSAFLDTFLLSCRVLGRHLESWMLHHCVSRLRERGCDLLIAQFIPTERNAPAQPFLGSHGFHQLGPDELGPLLGPFPDVRVEGEFFAANLRELRIPYLELYAEKP